MNQFNKNYIKGIKVDYIKRVNFIKNTSKKGEKFNLFCFNNKLKKEQKKKLKQAFSLELISLQKSLFNFSIKKDTRKTTYIPVKIMTYLNKKHLNSFLFFFSQIYFANLQNFSKLAIKLSTDKVDIDILNTIDYLKKNQEILKLSTSVYLDYISKTKNKQNKYNLIQFLSFYKFKI